MTYYKEPKMQGAGVLFLAGFVLLVLFSLLSLVSSNKDAFKEMMRPEQGAN